MSAYIKCFSIFLFLKYCPLLYAIFAIFSLYILLKYPDLSNTCRHKSKEQRKLAVLTPLVNIKT